MEIGYKRSPTELPDFTFYADRCELLPHNPKAAAALTKMEDNKLPLIEIAQRLTEQGFSVRLWPEL